MSKITLKFDILLTLILLSVALLSGCGLVPLLGGVISVSQPEVDTDPELPPVFGPEAAREAALGFIRANYGDFSPAMDLVWDGGETQVDEQVGSSRYEFLSGEWTISVTFPVVAPDAIVYTVKVKNEDDTFYWEGLLDAYGQVVTTAISTSAPSPTPEPVDPEPTDEAAPAMATYQDDFYKIAMEYSVDWTLTEIPGGENDADGEASKVLRFSKDAWMLFIHYKFRWEDAALGGGLPAGDIVERGFVSLFNRAIPKHVLVYQGKDKVVFYGDRFEYLEFHLRLEKDLMVGGDYELVDIPEDIVLEMDAIAASIVQTGVPVIPPTPTPEPTPTPAPPPCNAAKFIADVTVPDGTTYAPNSDFTKVWRLENTGVCTWTKAYDLVYVDGARMDGKRALALPKKVSPGERVDLSVSLNAPYQAGDYQGFWMLRSSDGEVFGLGSAANKPFWVSISVVEPKSEFGYDFALNFCSATWRSEEGRLTCVNSGDSNDGFVKLLENPNLENRHENEFALWVHPNEQRFGWIEGTYPALEVESGDHFMAWVGCLEGYSKCSLKFYLDYEDEKGHVHRLGEWVETYDGDISTIDINLSSYAGQTIQLILGVEALTRNVNAAHGFWFVPRLDPSPVTPSPMN